MTSDSIDFVQRASDVYGYRLHPDQHLIKTVKIDGTVVVLLEDIVANETDPDGGRNVFAFDSAGALIWRVQNAGFTSLGANGQQVPQGYNGISERGGELFAFQPIGCLCKIDIATGGIVSSEQTR